MTEQAKLPAGWCWAKVAEVGEVKLGRQRSPEHHTGEHMRPYLRVANVYEDRIDLSDALEMNFTPQEYEVYRLRSGDILLNEGQSHELVGRPALYRDELPGACFQNTLVRFRAGEAVNPRFAILVFRHYLHAKRFQKLARWTVNIAHLGAARFAEVEFPVPPLPEQERIVGRAEELFSDLDAGVAALERARANLKKYRAAVLKAAVTGDLTADWRAVHPHVEPATKLRDRILAERRRKWEADQQAKYAASGKAPSGGWQEKYPEPEPPRTESLPALPRGWCWATLDQLNRAERPISYGVLQPGPDLPDGVPLVRVCDVAEGAVDESQLKRISPDISAGYQRTVLEGGEVLLTVVGTIGRTAVAPASLRGANTARAVAVIPVLDVVPPRYVELNLREGGTRQRLTLAAHEVARKTLNLEDVRKACIPLAPLGEQQVIIAEVERRLSVIAATADYVAASLKRAGRLRQSILKEAFAGRLVPQDPADEPASALLDRIRQARGSAAVNRPRGRRKNADQPEPAE